MAARQFRMLRLGALLRQHHRSAYPRHRKQGIIQCGRKNRLCQKRICPGQTCILLYSAPVVSCYNNNCCIRTCNLPYSFCHFNSVHIRHLQVHQADIILFPHLMGNPDLLHALLSGQNPIGTYPQIFQKKRCMDAAVAIVIRYQHLQ